MELIVAKRNEMKMKQLGAVELGQEHYVYIVLLHSFFFISFIVEVVLTGYRLSPLASILFVMFIFLQALRIWTIRSLGMFWNTKVIILPDANVVKRGPYHFLRHPNYVIVALEIVIIPILFNAYVTAILFSVLNSLLLTFVRIPFEEKALSDQSNYSNAFASTPKFLPQTTKRQR